MAVTIAFARHWPGMAALTVKPVYTRMKTSRVKGKIVCGVILIVAGFGLALNGFVSGPHAFWGAVSGMAGLWVAGLLLAELVVG